MDVSGRLPAIRGAIELRYRLLPYLYTLLWQAHADDEPMLRPTFLDHEHDAQTFEECDEFLLGRDLLVASVVEAGQRSAVSGCRITKPAGTILHPRVVRGRAVDRSGCTAGKTAAAGARRCRSAAQQAHHSRQRGKDDTRELKLFPVKAWAPAPVCCLKMTVKAGAIRTAMRCG